MKRQYAFVSAIAENDYEVQITPCKTLKEAQNHLKKIVEGYGEKYSCDFFLWIDKNDKLMYYGAFDLNTSLYGNWLLLIDEYLRLDYLESIKNT